LIIDFLNTQITRSGQTTHLMCHQDTNPTRLPPPPKHPGGHHHEHPQPNHAHYNSTRG